MINKKLFTKNQKGSVEIVLLVLLVLIVTLAALFNFTINSNKIGIKIADTKFIEKLYLRQDLMEFYLMKAGEKAIIATDEGEELISEEKLINNFKTEFKNYEFDEQYLKDLKEIIEDGNFKFFIEEDFLYLGVTSLELKESSENVNIIYHPKIFLEFNLEKIRKIYK